MNTESNTRAPGAAAIELWERLTGRQISNLGFGSDLEGFSLYEANKRIKEAIKTGDEAIITLLIRSQVPRYAAALTFPLTEYRNGSERLSATLATMDELESLFEHSPVANLHRDFLAYAEGSLAFYRGQERDRLSQASRDFVATEAAGVGLDALNTLDRLTRLMIQDGVPAPASEAKLGRHIYEIGRIEDLLMHAKQIPTGFSLCVIRGEHISSSYFVMLVRTGTRILALTDKGRFEHPLQEERMASRNVRYNAYRIDGSHFPYSLLQIEWLDRGRGARPSEPVDRTLPTHGGLPVLADISELDDRELLWLHLFIDQCRHHYFEQAKVEPLLATGSMLKIAHKLDTAGDQYPVLVNTRVSFTPRASKDLTAASMSDAEPNWARYPNPNLWMEERFADQVAEEFLYIPESVMRAGQLQIGWDAQGGLTLRQGESRRGLFEPGLKSIRLGTLDTPEQLVADAHYTARHNQVEIIRGLAAIDYEQREEEVQLWFYKAVAKNLPAILDDLLLANHARFRLPRTAEGRPMQGVQGSNGRNISYIYEPRSKQYGPDPRDKLLLEDVIGVTNKRAIQWDCYLQPGQHVQANLFITLSTDCIHDLVAITGLPLDEIPPELHSRGLNIYTGNHNLERLDPLSRIRNPWDKLTLRFRLPVSFKAFKAYRAERGHKTPATGELYDWGIEGGKLAHVEGLTPEATRTSSGGFGDEE